MVKLAVSVFFAAALASVVVAQDAVVVEDVNARDVAAPSAEQDLFGRAAVKVMNDLFSREEINEMFGREVEELSQRDIDELFEREIEVDEATALAAREAAGDFIEEFAARQEEGAAAEEGAEGAAEAPKPKPKKPTTKDPKEPKPKEDKPKGGHVGGWLLRWFRKTFYGAPKDNKAATKAAPKAPKAPAAKPATKPAAALAAEEGAEGGEAQEAREFDLLEEPIERSFGDDDAALNEARELIEELELLERDFDESEVLERDVEDLEDVFGRELEDDLLERELEDDLLERDFEDDVFERDFEDDVFERELGEEWDDELLRRAFDVIEELEQLD